MIYLIDESRIVDICRNRSWGPAGKNARNCPIAVVRCRQRRSIIPHPPGRRIEMIRGIGRIQGRTWDSLTQKRTDKLQGKVQGESADVKMFKVKDDGMVA